MSNVANAGKVLDAAGNLFGLDTKPEARPKRLSFVPQMIGKENWRGKMNDFGSSIPNDALKV